MKVKTICNISSSDLDKEINDFIKDKKIIDIKFTEVMSDDNPGDWSALVIYEEKRNRHLQQKKFNLSEGEDPNEFMKNHDVVNVSTLRDEGWDELITVVTYEDGENNDKN